MVEKTKENEPKVHAVKRKEWATSVIERLRKASEGKKKMVTLIFGDTKRGFAFRYEVLRENLAKIVSYVDYLKIQGLANETTQQYHARVLLKLANFCKKPFKRMTRKDIEKFLIAEFGNKSLTYQNGAKIIVRSFFRWLYGTKDYPKVVSWISLTSKRAIKKTQKLPEVLTIEEIQKMIDVCDNARDKALIAFLYESGCRLGEVLNVRIKDLHFDEYGAVVTVHGKTGSRRIRLVSCVPALKEWLNVHPHRSDPNWTLFTTMNRRNYGGPLSKSSLDDIVKRIAKRAGIKKRVYAHLFRHSRATHLAKHLREMELRIYFGWSKDSDMPARYIHLAGSDVEDEILAINGIKKRESERPERIATIKCPRCGEENLQTNKFCYKCGMILDSASLQRIETVKQIVSEVLLYIFQEMQKRKIGESDLEELVKEWLKKNELS